MRKIRIQIEAEVLANDLISDPNLYIHLNSKILSQEIIPMECPRCHQTRTAYRLIKCNYKEVPMCSYCLRELLKPLEMKINSEFFELDINDYVQAGKVEEIRINHILYKPSIWDARARDWLTDRSIFKVYDI